MTDYAPLGRRVLCRPIITEDRYPGSALYVLPATIEVATKQQAEVVAVGPGAYDPDLEEFIPVDPRLKPGAWILHGDFARVWVSDDLFFLNDTDIVAILDMEDA